MLRVFDFGCFTSKTVQAGDPVNKVEVACIPVMDLIGRKLHWTTHILDLHIQMDERLDQSCNQFESIYIYDYILLLYVVFET